MSLCAMGSGSPSWRAMCTLRATSSHITAVFTAAFGSLPMVNTPWLRRRTASERRPGKSLDDSLPDVVVADQGEQTDGDLSAELVTWEATVLELAYDAVDHISAHAYYSTSSKTTTCHIQRRHCDQRQRLDRRQRHRRTPRRPGAQFPGGRQAWHDRRSRGAFQRKTILW